MSSAGRVADIGRVERARPDVPPLEPNHVTGTFLDVFQIQQQSDHRYASASGKAEDCPQPDAGLIPGERASFKPEGDGG